MLVAKRGQGAGSWLDHNITRYKHGSLLHGYYALSRCHIPVIRPGCNRRLPKTPHRFRFVCGINPERRTMIKNLPRVALTLCLAISTAFAATSRSSWVVSDIYNYNHPYAATDSTDLATKMSTMNSSEFLFFRGTDDIFYHDMTTLSASSYVDSNTAYTWLGGDTHIANFGGLEDSSGKAVFAVNDFDEGYLGQFVWDVRRTAASIVLAGRENGISDSNITTAINTFVSAYLAEMKTFSGGSGEKTFQLTTSNTAGQVKTTISDSSGDSRSDLLSKYTTTSNGKRIFQTSSTLATGEQHHL